MNIKCDISLDFDFQSNKNMLNIVYLPMIGRTAIQLYDYLISMHDYRHTIGANINFYVEQILSGLAIEQEEFNKNLHILEAIGLIETYVDQNKGDFMLFKLNEPLKWGEFTQDLKKMALFKNSVDEMEYEKTKFLFEANKQTNGLVNQSATFESIFSLNKEEISLNFDFVYELYLKQTGNFITLSDDNKVMLNNAYSKYNLSMNDLTALLLDASIKDSNNLVSIDNKLLAIALKKLVDTKYIKNFNATMKLNRNKKIFMKNANLNEFKYIIDDYRTINSEQYLACMQKHTLNELEINMINNLRKNYNLPDFAINILVDYCVVINHGRVEPQYIQKIALTINRLGLDSVNDIIIHLQNASSKRNMTMLQGFSAIDDGEVQW